MTSLILLMDLVDMIQTTGECLGANMVVGKWRLAKKSSTIVSTTAPELYNRSPCLGIPLQLMWMHA